MKKLVNDSLLKSYVDKFHLENFFETNMLSYMSLYHFSKGENICEVCQPMETLYFLVAGKLSVYTFVDNGKPLLLRFNKPLSIIGDLEFLNNYNVKCNVESLTPSTLIGISFSHLYTYAYDDAKFLRFLIKNLSHKLYTLSNSATINLLTPVENRFASYLLSSNLDENSHLFINEIKTTKLTEIATLLGTSYRHLNRIMNKFLSEEIIKKDKNLITITNFEKLKMLAKDNIYE